MKPPRSLLLIIVPSFALAGPLFDTKPKAPVQPSPPKVRAAAPTAPLQIQWYPDISPAPAQTRSMPLNYVLRLDTSGTFTQTQQPFLKTLDARQLQILMNQDAVATVPLQTLPDVAGTRNLLFTPEDAARVRISHPLLTPEIAARVKVIPIPTRPPQGKSATPR